jgi:hypothetical protein
MGTGGHQAKWEYFRAIYDRYRKAGQAEAGDPGRILPEHRPRLRFKWRDDAPHGYILKWLEADPVSRAERITPQGSNAPSNGLLWDN